MIIYYENSKKEKIDLLSKEYHVVNTDVFDSRWDASTNGYEKKVEIDVMDDNNNIAEKMNHLYNILAYDSENGLLGRLYINGMYIQCNVVNSKKDGWKGNVRAYVVLTFNAPKMAWIEEQSKMFIGSQIVGKTAKSYPYDYPYDYAPPEIGRVAWYIDSVKPSQFSMIINGYAENPEIDINGHIYKVWTTLNDGEYLVIDSQTKTITKTLVDGTVVNVFHLRDIENDVFKPIPEGSIVATWSGAFVFKLFVYKERREPLWM